MLGEIFYELFLKCTGDMNQPAHLLVVHLHITVLGTVFQKEGQRQLLRIWLRRVNQLAQNPSSS